MSGEEENEPLLSPSTQEGKSSTSHSLAIPTGSTNAEPEETGERQEEQGEEEEEREPTEEEKAEELKFYANQVVLLILPIFLTFILTIWWARQIFYDVNVQSSFPLLVYQEDVDDSTGKKIGGAILNALIILGCLLVVTVIFVVLFYYNCMKVIFTWLIGSTIMILGGIGGIIFYYLLMDATFAVDWLTFIILLWNFAVVGIVSIFWNAPLYIQQAYLVVISGLVATNLLQLPEWTAFALLAVVAIYDLFAVLCPKGPLKVLVNTAQERNQTVPALLYSAGMADHDNGHGPTHGAYSTIESGGNPLSLETSRDVELTGQDDQNQPAGEENQEGATQEGQPRRRPHFRRSADPDDDEPRGIQLGLGDFIFYSVLVGRAALTDWVTIVACSCACIVGLCLTLLLLAIFRKALPALPISIALGLIFYFLTSLVLTPMVDSLALPQVFL